mgnify:FL=1
MGKRDDKRLKKVINLEFIIFSLVAIAVTMVLSTFIFYEVYKAEIIRDLKGYAEVLKNTGDFDADDTGVYASVDTNDLRLTLIAPDGSVLYDNQADETSMQNHLDRPEIAEAFENGDGQVIRKSATLNKSTYYYAILLKSGRVLRIARETNNVISMFLAAVPVMLVVMAILVCVTIIVTHYLTRNILKPIEQMANSLDDDIHIVAYKEMRPFIDMIQKQHADIVKSSQMRQEFTANVSHELKTPLTSISGYSELIETGMATEADVHHFATEIHRNSNRLLTLINDIIRLSELDVSEDAPLMEKIDLAVIARTATDMLAINAEKNSVALSYDGNHGYIYANKMMMEELVYNLTDNAIRYNNKNGSVDVSVKAEDGKVILRVKDTGIGIPKEHQERIFERFYRVDKSRSKSTGGTGLGLAIVKHIVARNNAQLDMDSEPGKGTDIKVTFDAYREDE